MSIDLCRHHWGVYHPPVGKALIEAARKSTVAAVHRALGVASAMADGLPV